LNAIDFNNFFNKRHQSDVYSQPYQQKPTDSQTNVTQLLPPYTYAVSIFNRIKGEILQIFV